MSPSKETGFGDHIIQHMISQSLRIMQRGGVPFFFFLKIDFKFKVTHCTFFFNVLCWKTPILSKKYIYI